MDPFIISHMGYIRQQEILAWAQGTPEREPLWRVTLPVGRWLGRIIQNAGNLVRRPNIAAECPQYTLYEADACVESPHMPRA